MVKILRLLLTIAIISGAYYWNNTANFLPNFQFTGLVLIAWIAWGLLSMAVIKIYKNKKGIPQEKHSYSLPDTMAKIMKNVDLQTQYESAILSSFLIMVGILSMAIYFIFFYPVGTVFKILTGMNSIFGLMFMSSNLVTVYQQYVIYMQTQDLTKAGIASGEMLPPDFGGMDTKILTGEAGMTGQDNINSNVRRDSKNA